MENPEKLRQHRLNDHKFAGIEYLNLLIAK